MQVQIDRFEDNGWAVMLPYPEGKPSFDVPCRLLPADAAPGDVLSLSFEHDREETERLAAENRRLMDELLERGDQ